MTDLTTSWGDYAEPGRETARLRATFLRALFEHAREELDAVVAALHATLWAGSLEGAERELLSCGEWAMLEGLRATCETHIPPGLRAEWFFRHALWVASRCEREDVRRTVGPLFWLVPMEDEALLNDDAQDQLFNDYEGATEPSPLSLTWPLSEEETRVRLPVRGRWNPFRTKREKVEAVLRQRFDLLMCAELDRIERAAVRVGKRIDKARMRESERDAEWLVLAQVRLWSPAKIARTVHQGEATVRQAIARIRRALELPAVEATVHAAPPGRPRKTPVDLPTGPQETVS
ncbi:MAG: hypothetical protein EB084_25575 [Proteobacteria bacterium]|nr:hypothetical protein [Pseudomonadota bacterium]